MRQVPFGFEFRERRKRRAPQIAQEMLASTAVISRSPIAPDGDEANEGYTVMRDALAKTGKVAQFIMQGREHLVGITEHGKDCCWRYSATPRTEARRRCHRGRVDRAPRGVRGCGMR